MVNPHNIHVVESGYFVDNDILIRVPMLLKVKKNNAKGLIRYRLHLLYFQCLGLVYGCLLLIGSSFLLREPNNNKEQNEIEKVNQDHKKIQEEITTSSTFLCLKQQDDTKAILRSREFYLLWLSRFGIVLISQG